MQRPRAKLYKMAVEDGLPRFGTVRLVGGQSLVSQRVAFSNDSKTLFCCCGHRIRVYSTGTGDLLRELRGHEKNVSDFKVNPKNNLQLVSCSFDGDIIVWDYTDASILQKYSLKTFFVGLLLHPAHDGSIFLIEGRETNTVERKKQTATEKLGVLNTKEWKKGQRNFEILLEISGNSKQSTFSGKGDVLASVKADCLYLWDFNSKKSRWFSYKEAIFTCAAFHPSEACVAAGDTKGRIILWQGVDQLEDPVITVIHWHSHAVRDLAFTNDGSSILSGGEESVLVLWQYKTHHRQFLPRLGAHLTHVTVSPDDSLTAICQKDNVIRLISNVEWGVKRTIQGLKQSDCLDMQMLFDPRSRALVSNSMPGILQFYKPQDDRHAFTLDVVKQNYITKTSDEKLYFSVIDHAAFSDDGIWLATVERRDDKKNAMEMRLKFWEYNKTSQSYALNTCVDKPHNNRIVVLQFRPRQGVKDSVPLVMTAGTDGKFEIWILAEEELVKEKKSSWCCRSVGYYGDTPCQDAAFSQDGSVLAVAYSQTITLWTPDTNELRKTLALPYPKEEIRTITFGNNKSSQYLIVTTKSYLTVWNLLSCSVSWSVEANVTCLAADPQTNLIYVFLKFAKPTSHLYVFDPASPCPVAVQSKLLKSAVLMAAFDPRSALTSRTAEGKNFHMSQLYFLSGTQELFTLDCNERTVEPEVESAAGALPEEQSEQQSDFFKIFGPSVKSKGEATSVHHTGKSVRGTPSSAIVRQMLSTPSHVLPSVSSLCSTFLQSLLVSKHNTQSENRRDDEDDSDEEDESMEVEDDSDSETTPVTEAQLEKSTHSSTELTDNTVSLRHKLDIGEPSDLENVNFGWLQEYFTSS